jgi:hypothetical protein
MALSGGIVLEEALDLSSDRLLMTCVTDHRKQFPRSGVNSSVSISTLFCLKQPEDCNLELNGMIKLFLREE